MDIMRREPSKSHFSTYTNPDPAVLYIPVVSGILTFIDKNTKPLFF